MAYLRAAACAAETIARRADSAFGLFLLRTAVTERIDWQCHHRVRTDQSGWPISLPRNHRHNHSPGRIYLSASFDDDGEPARFVCKVFDSDQALEPDYDG
jgi:hypothetical protein